MQFVSLNNTHANEKTLVKWYALDSSGQQRNSNAVFTKHNEQSQTFSGE
jgi:hypothetical protein